MVLPMTPNDIETMLLGLPSIGVITWYGISIIRRRASADNKVINEDRSYKDMLEQYKRERDEIKEERDRTLARMELIEHERNEAVGKVGKLTAEVEFLSQQVKELKSLVEKLGDSLNMTRTEMHVCAIENTRLSSQVEFLERMVQTTKPGADDNENSGTTS